MHTLSDNHHKMDIEISINEVTTPTSQQITEIRRKWFEVQKINTLLDDEDNSDIDINIIDLDIDSVSESSGSGMDGGYEKNSDVTILPLRTNKPVTNTVQTTPSSGITNSIITQHASSNSESDANTQQDITLHSTKQSTLTPNSYLLKHLQNKLSHQQGGGEKSDFIFSTETAGKKHVNNTHIYPRNTMHNSHQTIK